MKLILIGILWGTMLTATAQVNGGYVFNKLTGEALPYTTIVQHNLTYGTSSDINGYFEIRGQAKDSIVFTYIGFNDLVIAYYDLPDTVWMDTSTNNLPEVEITAQSARQIIYNTIKKINENHIQPNFVSTGFYRQYHKEDGKYVRLIEAKIDVWHREEGPFTQAELVNVKALRRSFNYEQNGEDHGNHLLDLLVENPIYHLTGSCLNEKSLNSYYYRYDSLIIVNNSLCHQIYFELIELTDQRLESGTIWINSDDLGIVKLIRNQTHNPNAINAMSNSIDDYLWEFRSGTLQIEFEKRGTYQPTFLKLDYDHHLYANPFGTTDHDVQEYFEYYIDTCQNIEPIMYNTKPFKRWPALYTGKTDNTAFENDLKSLPALSKNLIKDLSRNQTLNDQFRTNNY